MNPTRAKNDAWAAATNGRFDNPDVICIVCCVTRSSVGVVARLYVSDCILAGLVSRATTEASRPAFGCAHSTNSPQLALAPGQTSPSVTRTVPSIGGSLAMAK